MAGPRRRVPRRGGAGAGGQDGAGLGAAPPIFVTTTSTSWRLGTLLVGALVIGLVGVGGPATWVQRSAAGRIHPVTQWQSVPHLPVTLVLGAGLDGRGGPSPFLAARLDVAQDLYRRGVTSVLLLSGSRRGGDHDEPAVMRDYLLARGVPAEHLVTDGEGHDTYASCQRAQHVYGVSSMLVVSQTYHLPRALAICGSLGLEAVGVGDDTMRTYEVAWRGGELREYPANVKAVWDVLVRRHRAEPADDPPDPAVHQALRASGGRNGPGLTAPAR